MDGLNACVKQVCTTEKEPRDTHPNNDCGPNIVVFDTDEGLNIDLHVAFNHPWSSKVLSKSAAEEDGFPASAREERKRKKYAKLPLSGGGTNSPTLIPLVFFEHFRRWGKKQKDT